MTNRKWRERERRSRRGGKECENLRMGNGCRCVLALRSILEVKYGMQPIPNFSSRNSLQHGTGYRLLVRWATSEFGIHDEFC